MASGCVLHDALTLPLNTDCAEFCPLEGRQSLLAVGTYQLVEGERPRRDGGINLYEAVEGGSGARSLQPRGELDLGGVFDIKWVPRWVGTEDPLLGVALADGCAAVCAASEASGVEKVCSSTGLLESGMALSLDWSPRAAVDVPTIAVSSSAGELATARLLNTGLEVLSKWKAHELETWVVTHDRWKRCSGSGRMPSTRLV
eukprot:evm.model.scf_1041.3 EVM.evm.TU.scf_1041.3   scf_1041:6619-8530(-)